MCVGMCLYSNAWNVNNTVMIFTGFQVPECVFVVCLYVLCLLFVLMKFARKWNYFSFEIVLQF